MGSLLKRLLVWLRLRRPPAARGPDTVVDMSTVIAELEPDESMFTTMLKKLTGPPVLQLEDLAGQIKEIRRARTEWIDWRECFPERNNWVPEIDWMEDDLFPRVTA